MLTHLQLRDLVIVDRAELDFGPGLTALTGETGAGKSIVVDALLLIAGGRGGGDVVRRGAERAEVAASFAALPGRAAAWLDAQGIEHEDEEIVVRRVIAADGRSRAYVNGQLVPLQLLREFSEFLVEIHGQQDFQHLVERATQRQLVDDRIEDSDVVRHVSEVYGRYRQCRQEYDALKSVAVDRESRLDLLRYQLRELAAVTTVAAIEELFTEQKRLAGSGRLSAAARTALTAVYDADTGSAHDLLARASAALRSVLDADPELARPAQLLEEATILAREAAETLRRYLERLEVDPARQEELEAQAAALEALARKHRCSPLDLPAERARLEQEVHGLDQAEESLAEHERRLVGLESSYRAAAERLTQARQRTAMSLDREITALMQALGMAGGRFSVSVKPRAEFAPYGADDIEFLVSANPGQPFNSLAKVASGGELSRISLAIRVAAAAKTSALCMVFDEVDAGIGGGVAEIVGRQLRELGKSSQVLCVTHLAQVAAQAHSQFRVIKHTDGNATRTDVKTLSSADRVDELARMLGGVDISEQARAHAAAMLGLGAGTPAAKPPGLPKKRVKDAPH